MTDAAPPDVTFLDSEADAEWRRFVKSRLEGSVYHTLEWRDVLARTFGFVPRYLIARRAGHTVGVLPLLSIHKPILGEKLVSTPFSGSYPAVLAADDEAAQALVEAAARHARERGARYLELRSSEEIAGLEESGFQMRRPLFFPEAPLISPEANLKSMAASHRRNIAQARKQGVSVSEASDPQDLRSFHRIMLDLLRGFGVPCYPIAYFANILDLLGSRSESLFLVARHGDRIIGGAVFLIYNRKLIYKNGACLLDSLHLRPYNALLWRAMEIGLERGLTAFNLGATSPGDEGLLRFKVKWGAEVQKPRFYYLPVTGSFPDLESYFDRFRAAKIAWRLLPRFAAARIGPRLMEWVC